MCESCTGMAPRGLAPCRVVGPILLAVAAAGLRAPMRPAVGPRRTSSVAHIATLEELRLSTAAAAAAAAAPAVPAVEPLAATAGPRWVLVADMSRARRASQWSFAMKDGGDMEDPAMSEKERRTRAKLHERKKRRGFLGRFSRRLREENLPEPEEIDLQPIVKDVDAAIASRRRRLNAKMGSALKEFREVRRAYRSRRHPLLFSHSTRSLPSRAQHSLISVPPRPCSGRRKSLTRRKPLWSRRRNGRSAWRLGRKTSRSRSAGFAKTCLLRSQLRSRTACSG